MRQEGFRINRFFVCQVLEKSVPYGGGEEVDKNEGATGS